MSAELLLGIDIGTASSKGVLVTPRGEIVARASRPHATSNPRPGWFEHDAETVWWADFLAIARELVAAAAGTRIAGVGVSGIGPCLLPADQDGTPLRPAILYGVDSRAGAQITQLDTELGTEEIRRIGGSPLTSQAIGPKLLWLRQCEPHIYAKTRMMLMASSFLIHRLTGRYVLDHHSASQCTPMYDLPAQRWNETWSEQIAPGLPLPELVWPTEVVGTVSPRAAELTGLNPGTPVAGGTIDAWAEATSVGVREPGDVMVMYGTTLFLIQAVDRMTSHPGLWSTAGVWPGSYNLAASMPTSGAITSWLSGITAAEFPTLVAEATASSRGANGLLLLPHFAGERTPQFDPDARGAVVGLSLSHTRGDLYRAALEGIAFGVRDNLETMADATRASSQQRLVAVGGGTQGGLWTQIVSDVTGLPQSVPRETVGACLGDALLAATASGVAVDPDSWNPAVGVVSSDPAVRHSYDARYRDYRDFGTAAREVAHRLAATQREPMERT